MNCNELNSLSLKIEKIKKIILDKPFNRHGMFNLKVLPSIKNTPDVSNFSFENSMQESQVNEINSSLGDYFEGVEFQNFYLFINLKRKGKSIQYQISLDDFILFLENFKGMKEFNELESNFITIDSDSEHEGTKVLSDPIDIKKRYSLIELKLRNYFNYEENRVKSSVETPIKYPNCFTFRDSASTSVSNETRTQTPLFSNELPFNKKFMEDEDDKKLFNNNKMNPKFSFKNLDFFKEINSQK